MKPNDKIFLMFLLESQSIECSILYTDSYPNKKNEIN